MSKIVKNYLTSCLDYYNEKLWSLYTEKKQCYLLLILSGYNKKYSAYRGMKCNVQHCIYGIWN